MSEVANTMKTGFNSLATSLKVIQAQIDSIENKVNSTASAQQSDMRAVTGNIAELLMHTAEHLQNQPALTAPISVDEASGANHDDETHINYRMNRNLVTVTDAWRAYGVGLVEHHGTGLRKDDRRESWVLSRTITFMREVKRLAAQNGISSEQAVDQLEISRV
ncbi:uncharacterized protein EV154DRAFT_487747 [Mucor mucedo]|uniref:uncharacterized protein n=1 Tax=Mucor mucedo TaxID=29922 RepID=UPI002220EA01|nr:uncharacterized protein EV154DRAFT_487747 [Mucor mucedo]KAI7870885.1 hypothetical protein EV154DRAFT_487747 [Mucor mucedo]